MLRYFQSSQFWIPYFDPCLCQTCQTHPFLPSVGFVFPSLHPQPCEEEVPIEAEACGAHIAAVTWAPTSRHPFDPVRFMVCPKKKKQHLQLKFYSNKRQTHQEQLEGFFGRDGRDNCRWWRTFNCQKPTNLEKSIQLQPFPAEEPRSPLSQR